MPLHIIILAAGKGTRMQSSLPKVLHRIAGKPMLQHIIETGKQLNPEKIHIVVGHEKEQIATQINDLHSHFIPQEQQAGTAHAVATALPFIPENNQVLILFGDVPLISKETLEKLIQYTPTNGLGIVTAKVKQPFGLGRIIRNHKQQITKIVEHKDASFEELEITEINTGILYTTFENLYRWLPKISNDNQQQEYYLPDIIPFAIMDGCPIISIEASSEEEIQGVNERHQLIALERYFQQQQAHQLLIQGISILDPNRFDLRGTLQASADVTIDVNVVLEGNISIGEKSYIGPNCFLKNVHIGKGVTIHPNSVIEGAHIGDHCRIGPFARIRPETKLAEYVHIGNFVEVKNTEIAKGSKANHLSYLGDAKIGKSVNIGAGTITCNYDGANKHQTIINDNAFIGSGTELIAPVTIGQGATIGAGSTITKDVPTDTLTISRVKQTSITGWKRPTKKSERT
ncbi:MAG: Bifunctional protein GlmU [Legionellaceae bacterium]